MLGEFMGQKQFSVNAGGGRERISQPYVQVSSYAKLYVYNLLPVKCKSSLHV